MKCDPSLTAMGILEYSAQDIANQLTEIEWNMWVNIRETELLGLGWTKKNKLELSPNGMS